MKPGLLVTLSFTTLIGSRTAVAAAAMGIEEPATDPGVALPAPVETSVRDSPPPADPPPPAGDLAPATPDASGAPTPPTSEIVAGEAAVTLPDATSSESAETAATPKATLEDCRELCENLPNMQTARKSAPPSYGTLGLSPGAPQVSTLPGGMTPSFGSPAVSAQDWRFQFNGFFILPLRAGIAQRENAFERQRKTTLHTPPLIPGDFETFDYTGVVPNPWVQLNFGYGNNNVTATVIVAARSVSNANSFFNPPDQLGINDAFITVHPQLKGKARFNAILGAFANRYGIMGQYDLGRYGTPIIGRVSGVGATATGTFEGRNVHAQLEGGLTGTFNKAPLGVEPQGWNGFADPNVGSSYAGHAHVAISFRKLVHLGAHWITAFSSDDRSTSAEQPDGEIHVLGADARLTMGRFGHLYAGYAFTKANDARSVSSVLRVLNAPGGPGLIRAYLGPNSGGNGALHTLGAQYDFSLGNALRFPEKFEGEGADLIFSIFGILTDVSSDDATYNNVTKLKYGAEVGYSALSWLAASVRYDQVLNDLEDATQTHIILSPRLIFRSRWNAQDQIVLQYSHFFNGSGTAPIDGWPPRPDPEVNPDEHVVSLSVAMWW